MRYSKAKLSTGYYFHVSCCLVQRRGFRSSDYTAKVSGDQVGFIKNVLFFIQIGEQLVCFYTKPTMYFSNMLELA